jgi:hypothetical protein
MAVILVVVYTKGQGKGFSGIAIGRIVGLLRLLELSSCFTLAEKIYFSHQKKRLDNRYTVKNADYALFNPTLPSLF